MILPLVPSLSVVIPTYRRADILKQCLGHLERQSIAKEIEVVVVSDGHDDLTARLFVSSTWQIPVRFFEIEKSHQGTARNRGMKEAQGDIILFIGDDIFLSSDACYVHLQTHRSLSGQKSAVLGFTTWDPALEITPVMRWLELSGWQFGYPAIERYAGAFLPSSIQHRFTYTSHCSVPRDIALAHPFSESVRMYGWEDVEWGARMRDAGVSLFYAPSAKAAHHHSMTLAESLRRMETLGEALVEITRSNPGFKRLPTGIKRFAYAFAGMLPTIRGKHRRAFLRGIRKRESARTESTQANRT